MQGAEEKIDEDLVMQGAEEKTDDDLSGACTSCFVVFFKNPCRITSGFSTQVRVFHRFKEIKTDEVNAPICTP